MQCTSAISERRIDETPVAVVDFETTGLAAGCDRVLEVSVVRIDPGEEPRLAFDSLVNPCRPVAGTEIHGITDADVARAPRFPDIAGEVLEATKGCAVAAYNVYFDVKFLNFEMANAGAPQDPPHFCLMYLRPMLKLGKRCRLEEACRAHGVEYEATHVAAHDAMAAGRLYRAYHAEMQNRHVSTFAELSALKSYKFCDSFARVPWLDASTYGFSRFEGKVSRYQQPVATDPAHQATAIYWDALKTVLADLEITDEELAYVVNERRRSGLKVEQARVLHARAFASVITQFCSDKWLDDEEVRKLRRLYQCLETLGWAPGQ